MSILSVIFRNINVFNVERERERERENGFYSVHITNDARNSNIETLFLNK